MFRAGILNEASFDKNSSVTRGDFIAVATQLLGIGNVVVPFDTIFKDVNADDVNSGFIDIAYNMGIISGYNDNTFRPNDLVSNN